MTSHFVHAILPDKLRCVCFIQRAAVLEGWSPIMDDATHAAGGFVNPANDTYRAPASTARRSASPAAPLTLPTEPSTDPAALQIVERLHGYQPNADGDLVARAFAVAQVAHSGQKRQSGEPYIAHPVAVANIMLDLRLDASSIAASLLHDVVEDTSIDLEQIEQHFSQEIALLVDGVTKLTVLESQTKEEAQAGTYRKMFIAMADDPRVVLIKLADRLHNMRTLGATPPEKQKRVARETLEIYAPLAHRLGIWQIKSELEDLAFKAINPEKYHEIARQLAMRRDARQRIVQRVITRLTQTLDKENIQGDITGRPKHIYSIHRKMERKGVRLEEIYDQLAVRVIVSTVAECYQVLGIVHNMWPPVPGEFDDYIAMPKESMYKSLHTTVLIPGGTPCEVQIRTLEMHEVAEHGIAAHWRYKEGFGRVDTSFEAKLAWLRGLIDWRRDLTDAREFVESLKTDMLEEQVYVFTPKGKIIDLPEGSTPIDFAYRIHSEVGHRSVGAKVNNKMVQLDYQLQNGEIVQVLTTKSAVRGPSRDWLNFVKTTSARNHIRRYFRKLERTDNIAAGRDLLEKELKRLALNLSFDDIAHICGEKNIDDVFELIGVGEVTGRTIAQKVAQRELTQTDQDTIPTITSSPQKTRKVGIQVRGVDNVLTRLARCCNPIESEPIVGYITRGKGITVHRADCRTIINERDRNRLIDVTWGNDAPQGYEVPIRIESWDRVGLWRDVSSTIADAGINISSLQQVPTRKTGRTVLVTRLTIQSITQLTQILDKLNRIPDVIDARRENNAAGITA